MVRPVAGAGRVGVVPQLAGGRRRDGRDTLLFVAGVAERPFTPGADAIWYLATADFDRHVRAALRMTRVLFDVEAWKYTKTSRLEQYLPTAYPAGIRFLEWLGWTRGDIVSMGRRQAAHMYFDRPEEA